MTPPQQSAREIASFIWDNCQPDMFPDEKGAIESIEKAIIEYANQKLEEASNLLEIRELKPQAHIIRSLKEPLK